MRHDRRRASGRRSGRQAGFSLIEVMVAFTILGVGLLAVAGAQLKSIHGTRHGRHLSQSALVAQTQVETLMRTSWTALAPTVWTAPLGVSSGVEDGNGGAVEQTYLVSWQIQDVIPDEARSIDVRVSWTESDGRARSIAASTIRFNREGP